MRDHPYRTEAEAQFWGDLSPLCPYTLPVWGLSDSEMRRRRAASLYELEALFAEEGWPSDLVYDAAHDLYRFPDGEFAFYREYVNERRLREEGMIG